MLLKKTAFYKNLGKLFYAIAAIDGIVRKEEYNAFLSLINTVWSNKNFVDKQYIHQIINEFEVLKKVKPSAQVCFDEFKFYKNGNDDLFTEKINRLIWETACTIASEVNKKNKSELIILVHLGKHLQIV